MISNMLRRHCEIEYLELKALSVPSSLRFLIGIETDVKLCLAEVGSQHFSLHFPVVAETFRKLLGLCATRFGMSCTHTEDGSVLSGKAALPLLRYVDYLPGGLHAVEVMDCLGLENSVTKPQRLVREDERPAAPGEIVTRRTHEFKACFLDYSEFVSEESLADVHGHGYYLTLDRGLSVATHGHLVGIRFHSDWDFSKSLREFQRFSGWRKFDLRFYDDQNKKQGGVIVMPSPQDVNDLLDRYEDEDSDDEGDLLPFILRPVAPLMPVPALEDSALKKLREQYWPEIVAFWERFPRTRNTVMVYNLYDGATAEELLSFLPGVEVVSAQLVEDETPSRRRRLFIEFATADGARQGLDLDGKSTRGKTLRAQVSPPYVSPERRGRVVVPTPPLPASAPSNRSQPTKGDTSGSKSKREAPAHTSGTKKTTSQGLNQNNRNDSSNSHSNKNNNSSRENKNQYTGAAANTSAVPKDSNAQPSALAEKRTNGAGVTKSHGLTASTAPTHVDPAAATAAPAHVSAPIPVSAAVPALPKSPEMNVNAKAFVPSFMMNVDSPAFVPSSPPPPPPPYNIAVSPIPAVMRPPPPPYASATGSPSPFGTPLPATNSPSSYGGRPLGVPPPVMGLPPPYLPAPGVLPPAHHHSGPPPPYSP